MVEGEDGGPENRCESADVYLFLINFVKVVFSFGINRLPKHRSESVVTSQSRAASPSSMSLMLRLQDGQAGLHGYC